MVLLRWTCALLLADDWTPITNKLSSIFLSLSLLFPSTKKRPIDFSIVVVFRAKKQCLIEAILGHSHLGHCCRRCHSARGGRRRVRSGKLSFSPFCTRIRLNFARSFARAHLPRAPVLPWQRKVLGRHWRARFGRPERARRRRRRRAAARRPARRQQSAHVRVETKNGCYGNERVLVTMVVGIGSERKKERNGESGK